MEPSFTIFVGALAAIFVWSRRKRRAAPESLPCPNLPCTNRLPRRGTWSHKDGEWAIEACPVCDASIQYRSGVSKSTALSPNDCYIRVAAPTKGPP